MSIRAVRERWLIALEESSVVRADVNRNRYCTIQAFRDAIHSADSKDPLRPTPVILLAEDDLLDRELTLVALRAAGHEHEVVALSDGLDVLAYLDRAGPFAAQPDRRDVALLLLDLRMPKIDGLELIERIRFGKHRALPIVVLTSVAYDHDIERAYEAGVNAFVVKPIAFDELKITVARIIHFWIRRNLRPK